MEKQSPIEGVETVGGLLSRLGVTGEELGLALGVSQPYVHMALNGRIFSARARSVFAAVDRLLKAEPGTAEAFAKWLADGRRPRKDERVAAIRAALSGDANKVSANGV